MSLSILFYKKRKSGPGSPRWLGFTKDGTSKGLSLGSPAIQKELSALRRPPPPNKTNSKEHVGGSDWRQGGPPSQFRAGESKPREDHQSWGA